VDVVVDVVVADGVLVSLAVVVELEVVGFNLSVLSSVLVSSTLPLRSTKRSSSQVSPEKSPFFWHPLTQQSLLIIPQMVPFFFLQASSSIKWLSWMLWASLVLRAKPRKTISAKMTSLFMVD